MSGRYRRAASDRVSHRRGWGPRVLSQRPPTNMHVPPSRGDRVARDRTGGTYTRPEQSAQVARKSPCNLCASCPGGGRLWSLRMRTVRTLKTSEAAAVLNVSPNTLRAWERRFGYPKPQRSPGKHRLYTHGEVAALRDALQEGLSISSAISRARESLSVDTSVLVGALQAFELERADAAMEAALALRSVERSVEEVLLPSLERDRRAPRLRQRALGLRGPLGGGLARPGAADRPAADAAQRDPLRRRHARRPRRRRAAPARRCSCWPSAPAPACSSCRSPASPACTEVLDAFAPQVVVVGGEHATDDEVARWAYRVRATLGPLPSVAFRRGPRSRRRGPARAPRRGARAGPRSSRRALARAASSPRRGHAAAVRRAQESLLSRPRRLVALPGSAARPAPRGPLLRALRPSAADGGSSPRRGSARGAASGCSSPRPPTWLPARPTPSSS